MRSSGLLLESNHPVGGVLHGLLQVSLGDVAGLGVLHGKLVNGGSGLLAEVADLGTEFHVDERLGVGVHLVATLLNELGTLLTLGDGVTDSLVELLAVGVLERADLLATLAGLLGIGSNHAGQLHDLLVGLGIVGGNHGTEVLDLLLELTLDTTGVVDGVKAGATDVGLHLGVLRSLGFIVLLELREDSLGHLLHLMLGVSAVAGEALADVGEGSVEGGSHGVQLAVGLLVVLGDHLLKLGIGLKVLAVTLVAKLDHAGHLGVHVSVDLGLSGGVRAHDTSGGIDIVVDLGDLLGNLGAEVEETNLELGGGGGNLVGGLSASSGDVGHGLGVTLVLEGLLGVESGLEKHGSLAEGHVDLVTVLGHLERDIVELGSSRSDEALDLVESVRALGTALGSELDGKTVVGVLLVGPM